MKSRFFKTLLALSVGIGAQASADTTLRVTTDPDFTLPDPTQDTRYYDADGKVDELDLADYQRLGVHSDFTIGKITNSAEKTVHLAANLTVNSDLEAKEIVVNQYDKKCELNVNGNLKTGSMTIDQGEKVVVSGTTEINVQVALRGNSTLQTGKLVINGSGSFPSEIINSTILADEIEVNSQTFSLKGGTISAADGSGTFTVGEGGSVTQQGTAVKLDTVVDGGTITMYKGSFDGITMEEGKLDVRGNVTTGALTLNGGELSINSGCVIDLGGNDLVLSDNVAITVNVLSLDDTLTQNYVLFTNMGEVTGSSLDVTFQTYDKTESQKAVLTYNEDGTVTVAAIPEPATVTLSLLALAGLCARRRRQ